MPIRQGFQNCGMLGIIGKRLREDAPLMILRFHSGDFEDHWIVGIGTAKPTPILFIPPWNSALESQSGDKGQHDVKCPVAKPCRREMLKDELIPHLQTERAIALFQNLRHPHLDLVFFYSTLNHKI